MPLEEALESVMREHFKEDLEEFRQDKEDIVRQATTLSEEDFMGLQPVPENIKAVMDWLAVCELLCKFYSAFFAEKVRRKLKNDEAKLKLANFLVKMGVEPGLATRVAKTFIDKVVP